jgi:hypothetical protein
MIVIASVGRSGLRPAAADRDRIGTIGVAKAACALKAR